MSRNRANGDLIVFDASVRIEGTASHQFMVAPQDGTNPSGADEIWTDTTGAKAFSITPVTALGAGEVMAIAWGFTTSTTGPIATLDTITSEHGTSTGAAITMGDILSPSDEIFIFAWDETNRVKSIVAQHSAASSLIYFLRVYT